MVMPPASQRCVILMTFTTERVKDNPEYRHAMRFLNDLDEEKVRKLHIDHLKRIEEIKDEGRSQSFKICIHEVKAKEHKVICVIL